MFGLKKSKMPAPEEALIGDEPIQGMRQGNDVGTQYRSGIYVYDPSNVPQLRRA